MSVSLIISGWLALAGPGAAGGSCENVVTGRVIDLETAEVIAGARVQLDSNDHVLSDDEGRFRFETICAGPHRLEVERADYRKAGRTLDVAGDTHVDVTVDPIPVDRLDDVVVVAPAALPSQMRATTTLQGEALERSRGRNLADSMARIPGVAVLRSSSGGQGKPIIRGQTGRRNLVLYDGVRLETQKWGIEHAPEIDPFSAGSISVIKGAGGTRYGPDAIGGVVLVAPPALRTEPGVSGQAHIVGVSNGLRGTIALRVDGAHRRVRGLSWRAEANITRGRALISPRYPLDNTGSRLWNAGGALAYDHDTWGAELKFRHYDLRSGLCSCLRNATPEEFDQSLARGIPVNADLYSADYAIERAFETVRHDIAIVRGWAKLGKAGVLRATYAFQNNHREEFASVRDGISGPQFEFDLETDSVDLVFEHREIRLPRNLSLVGSSGAAFATARNTFVSNQTLIPDYQQFSGGVFAVERLVAGRFELEAGARYDGLSREATIGPRHYASHVGQGRIDPDSCSPLADGGGRCSYPFHSGSGSIGALVRAVEHPQHTLEIGLDLASAARFPAVDEQFLDGGAPSFPVLGLGDARLGTERTWGASLTAAYAHRVVRTEASGYVNRIQNYINFRSFPQDGACAPLTCTVRGPFPVFGFDAIETIFYGLEYAITVAPPRWPVELSGQLTWVRAKDLGNDAFVAFIPPDRYRIAAIYHWPEFSKVTHGFVSVDGAYVDRQRRYDDRSDFAPPPSGYFLLGASVGLDLVLGDQTLKMAVVGSNLTNARYREYTSLLRYFADEPGWELLARLSLDFEIAPPARRARQRTR